ncbi:MAG: agmatine deiminase family protein [Saprospiraceae bacterium]|nr:agmatine deiminase family protein [Saprospiraceae bacterium]
MNWAAAHSNETTSPLAIFSPPPYPVRYMAEWEELQAIAITWKNYPEILSQIAFHAAQEVKVIVFCDSMAIKIAAESILQNFGVNMDNVEFVIALNDSAWIRDYGPSTVYKNEVEDLNFIDWVYNREDREMDDVLPIPAANHFGAPLFSATEGANRLVNVGGNFMTDGLGTAFSSKLVLTDNGPNNPFGAGPYSEVEIDEITAAFAGIERYGKMNTLYHDQIHHLDMHMKLLDEETLLVGEYPTDISDGPQIEANLAYLLENFQSYFGTPYQVIRIPQPPGSNGIYPSGGEYRNYANSVFVNKTILIPTYEEKYDSAAFRIYRTHFPGYKIAGINCNEIIDELGALHCITKEIGVNDPILIVHQRHRDVTNNDEQTAGYELFASIKHRSGIANATVYYRTDTTANYQSVAMQSAGIGTDEWVGLIPHQPNGKCVYYYISATANSTKTTVRPLAAPEGYFKFKVDNVLAAKEAFGEFAMAPIYPNPTNGITCIPVTVAQPLSISLDLLDVYGQIIRPIFSGNSLDGTTRHFLDASDLSKGVYLVRLQTEVGVAIQKIVVN